jgi:tRNA-dihydrouridine synthase C
MAILLAPMEGLLDSTLRDVLTRCGGIDRCVSEFIRVSGTLLPERYFLRLVPELDHGSRTPAGVPVRPQLMGSDPVCLAENAARLATFEPAGIDLNFGCPARTVNRHRGGAVLLDEPELIGALVGAVRRAVPAHIPISAKMRLGFNDDHRALDCAQAIAGNGAVEIVVHARTKADGYRPPAYWERIAAIRAAVTITVVANGEIWSVEDAARCRAASGCGDLMLGRGMVSDPGLALKIADPDHPGIPWRELRPLLAVFWQQVVRRTQPRHHAGRMKQWLHYLSRRYVEAEQAFGAVRRVDDSRLFGAAFFGDGNGGDEDRSASSSHKIPRTVFALG